MDNELNVEEVIFQEERSDQEYLELPLSRRAFLLVGIFVVLIGVVALSRTVYLNFLKGGLYAARAQANVNKEVDLPAPRGIITDRFGQPLVENKSSFAAYLNVGELIKDGAGLERTLAAAAEILGKPEQELRDLLAGVDLEKKSFIAVGRNITLEQAIRIRDLNTKYLQVADDYIRAYTDGPVFSHVLGYVGQAERSSDLVGKSGLELEYDRYLKGQDGTLIVYRDASGNALDTKIAAPPVSGSKVAITIDAELQRYFYKRLKDGLASLGRDAGVGLAVNPKNGEVLSLISLPSFDNNQPAKYLNRSNQPLFNRAISGVYTPGSTIKPLVALAALREKVATPDLSVFSRGYIEIPNPYDPEKPSRFVDWKPHGWVNVHSALAKSSNIYFYAVSGGLPKTENGILQGLASISGLGIERLHGYWEKFLLGVKTGIDLPSENSGFLPAPEEKEKRTGQIWRIGDTYNVSIGQGDLLLTPLQLIDFIASVANGGRVYRPGLLLGRQPQVLFDYSDWADELKEVREGMEDAVRQPYGTASMLAYLSHKTAGKTGSSQVANNTRTNAFFVGYGPAEDPEIAVLVLIENAKEGSLNAVPIARDVMQWYYENRTDKHEQ